MTDDKPDKRQQADALVEELQRESAGRLTVFLGAAPGVGKTYAMLVRAHELRRQGRDIAVGIVETHGREDTARQLQGLEVIPRRTLLHKGRPLEEMDLDAVLARRPAIVLVDELAHRNMPDSRHERRWQDVEELLDAGIDVYTTVNVQHLESLNDVVFQITGVRVAETVPDKVLDRLRDIRLVDLPARELIERLNQGKVYVPEAAERALASFFSPSNLTALRELAMQTVASHVDADLREHNAARGQRTVAGIRRHVLIAIDGHGQSQDLVRAGSRMAERRGATWSVVAVQRAHEGAAERAGPGIPGKGTDRRQVQRVLEIDRAFALARRLGGDTALLHGDDIASALLDAAQAHGATAIVLGRTRVRPVARLFNRTISQQLLRRGAQYEITLIGSAAHPPRSRHAPALPRLPSGWADLGIVLAYTAGAILTAWLADRLLGLQDVSMIFMLAVLMVGARSRMTGAVITALLCFSAYDFLFIEPRLTFHIAANQGVATVGLFLAAALIAGQLASRLRAQVLALRAANSHATLIQDLARKLSIAADLGQVLQVGRGALQEALGVTAWIAYDGIDVPPTAGEGPGAKDQGAMAWTRRHGQPSGRYTDTLSSSTWWFLPINAGEDSSGVVGLRFAADVRSLSIEQRRLAESMAEDIGQAALRTTLVSDLEAARVAGETERLRTALLSSVSHDLRSPLASMIGAADSLAAYADDMSREDRAALLTSITQEGQRLDRYIQNLLDMTRLGQQGLKLERDWIGVDELIASATRRLQRYVPQLSFEIDLPPDLPALHVHPALIEQALFNVLENAAKFSPPGAPVRIVARADAAAGLSLDIVDRGPGIPAEERRRVFDMFYSVERGDRGGQGTGLGLAIVQAIVGAHMGRTEAYAGPDGQGTLVRITLPPDVLRREADPPHALDSL